MRRGLALIALVLGFVSVRCSASGGDEGSGGNAGSGGSAANAGSAGTVQITDSGLTDVLGPPTGARLTGKVWGPHPAGKAPLFPVSGAAVIAWPAVPDAVPSGVYCEECVKLPASVPYAISGADGSFALDVPVGAHIYLGVQKGQFRRLRDYTAPNAVGDVALAEDLTTLPSQTVAGTGDTIPKIALVYGDYDHIEDVFAKVGIGQDDGAYGLSWGSQAGYFDLYDNSGPSEPHHGLPLAPLLADPAKLDQYQVILFECSYNANFKFMNDAGLQQRLRDWVWKGGKLYVSDYAMPVAEMPWHDFAWFTNPISNGCNENDFPPTCNHGPPFDALANIPDAPMAAWLDAQGLKSNLIVKENWDTIGSIDQGVVGKDPNTQADIYGKPKVWVEGPWNYLTDDLISFGKDPALWDKSAHPFTVTWPYNCGRVLFTTYHTVGGTNGGRHPGLLAQEDILFYLLMEITVCQDQPVIH